MCRVENVSQIKVSSMRVRDTYREFGQMITVKLNLMLNTQLKAFAGGQVRLGTIMNATSKLDLDE